MRWALLGQGKLLRQKEDPFGSEKVTEFGQRILFFYKK